MAAFSDGISQGGLREIAEIEMVARFADNQLDRLPALAPELVGNATGVSMFTNHGGKAAQLAAGNGAGINRVGLLMKPDKVTAESQLQELQAAANSPIRS
jgi:hypothetical protein